MGNHRFANLRLAFAAFLCFAATSFALAASPTYHFDIPAQPIAQALNAFARMSHQQIVFDESRLDGTTSTAISGTYTVDDALQRMLAGSGLKAERTAAGVIAIHAVNGPPREPARGSSQESQPASNDEEAKTLQTVVVTGTRASDRTIADSLSPIDVLTPKELLSTGAPDLMTALRALLPSFNFPEASNAGRVDGMLPAQLRGLSPDETLVLINGKRQHTSATMNSGSVLGRGSFPVDLNAIPMNAIQRIEVLRDGAAAQYGSDAIAGVVNIILKGGAQHGSVNIARGVHDGWQGHTWQAGADGGVRLGNNGWMHLAANYVNQHPTNHAGPDLRYPKDPTYGQVVFHYGMPYSVAKQAALNAQYNLGDNAELYAFSVFNKRDILSAGFYRSISEYARTAPAAADRFPDGFLPELKDRFLDTNSTLGIRGELRKWHYDVSGTTGSNHGKLYVLDSYNYSMGAQSPVDFYDGTVTTRQDVLDVDLTRDFDTTWSHPLTLAVGAAYRHETFTIKEGDKPSYTGSGPQIATGFLPSEAGSHSRSNTAAYVDLETNFTDKLSGGLAGRYEHYSDFGSASAVKLSGRYAFTAAVAIRGTASTGFRAPSLQQEFYSTTSTAYQSTPSGQQVQVTSRLFPVTDPAGIALGAAPLQPEKSRNYSVGVVLTPVVGPYVTLDLYQVQIDDRISQSGTLSGPAVQAYLTSVGIPFVTGGRFFTNAMNTRTRGADLIGSWPVQLADVHVKFTGGLNYNKTKILSIKPNPPQLGLAGLVLPILDRPEQGRITVGSPRTKAFIAADWTLGAWGFHGQFTRYGEWKVLGSTAVGDQSISPEVLLDLSANYTLDRWMLTFGGSNVTNRYPDRNNARNNVNGNLPYPQGAPFGFNGAYWYATAGYRW